MPYWIWKTSFKEAGRKLIDWPSWQPIFFITLFTVIFLPRKRQSWVQKAQDRQLLMGEMEFRSKSQRSPSLFKLTARFARGRWCLLKPVHSSQNKTRQGQQGSKALSQQPGILTSIPKTHIAKGENQLQQMTLWSPHVCHKMCAQIHTCPCRESRNK